jgi:predicted porin
MDVKMRAGGPSALGMLVDAVRTIRARPDPPENPSMPLARSLAAALMFTLPLAVQAGQAAVYGVIDTGVESLNHVAGSGRLTRVPALTGSVPSRLGFRAEEDLGDGLRAQVVLEGGLAADTGSLLQGGRMFGRTSTVGLTGAWGSLSVGRQFTMLFWGLLDADVIGPAVYSTASIDPYLGNPRGDNAVAWRGRWGGWSAGASATLGRDALGCAGESATDAAACRGTSALLKYDAPAWGVAAAVDRLNGGAGGGAGLVASALSDRRSMLNGYVKVGGLKLGGGLLQRHNQASALPDTDFWYAGISLSPTPLLVLDAALYRQRQARGALGADMTVLRATWLLSRRTAVYLTAGAIANRGASALSVSGGTPAGAAPAAGSSQTGVMAGLRHSF